eukprot:scaffold5206_cov154-Isochrysis_galbana.AAC.1
MGKKQDYRWPGRPAIASSSFPQAGSSKARGGDGSTTHATTKCQIRLPTRQPSAQSVCPRDNQVPNPSAHATT